MANKKLNATITIGGVVSSSLKGAFGSLKGNIGQIGGTIADMNRKQRSLNQSIKEYGKQGLNVDRMRQRYEENARQLGKLTAAQERLNRVKAAGDENQSRKDDLRSQIGETVAGVISVGYPIKAAMEFEDKMAEVRKVVDAPAGMDSKTYFGQLGEQIKQLSTQIPMTASEIGDLVAAGGQSGIASNELIKFAEAAGKMGVAFDISAEEAGQKMAEMKSAFRMTLPDVIELGDKINALSNSGAASASDVMDIVQRIGPLGEVANLASGQIAALGSTLRGMGVQNEVAATGIKNLMLTLTAGAMATKSQKAALAQLGLGSKQVAGSMQKDSRATITSILKRIKMLDKVHQPEVLNALFGKEVVGSIAPLLNNMGELQKQFDLVADKTQYAGSMQKEFESRAATTSNSLIIFRNWLNRIAITIGSTVLPQINQLIKASFPYLEIVSTLIANHPQLVQGVIAVSAAIVALRVASLAGGYAFATVNGYWLAGQRALAGLRMGFTLATVSARGFNLALIANPIGAVIAVIAAGALIVYRNWDLVKSFFIEMWASVTAAIDPARERFAALGDALGPVGDAIGWVWGKVKELGEWFASLFTPINHSKEELAAAGEAGKNFGNMLANAINFITQPIDWLVSKIEWLNNNIGGLAEKAKTIGNGVGDSIKSGWNRVTGWFGADTQSTGSDPSMGNGRPLPAIPAMAQQRGGGGYTDQSTTEIHVTQLPGEKGADFARRVVEEQQKAKQQQQRAYMPDNLAIP